MELNKITRLAKTLQIPLDYAKIRKESEEFCKTYNKDLRILFLGLRMCEEQKENCFYTFYWKFMRRTNFKDVWSKFTLKMLGDKEYGVINNCKEFPEREKAVQEVINLLEQYGDSIPEDKAHSAAYSAYSVAYSAYSAYSVAYSAYSAAYSAANSAANSAHSAYSAANSAANSAHSANSAAKSEHYKILYKFLMEEL